MSALPFYQKNDVATRCNAPTIMCSISATGRVIHKKQKTMNHEKPSAAKPQPNQNINTFFTTKDTKKRKRTAKPGLSWRRGGTENDKENKHG
ncbi:TPA: hypothetical protein DDW35_04255 [Candidatus Sumerlaeota bacterium]|jgi:hypothetical protein|nr:hypothetical protein [Candidatus Sumerlaeota bacterium]